MTYDSRRQLVNIASELAIAWLSNRNNRSSITDVTDVLKAMAVGMESIADGGDTAQTASTTLTYEGAVTVRQSLASPDHIISMIDGKPYTSLKRQLTKSGLTPVEYRQRYGLKGDYPMVAPGYSERRRAMAIAAGLGRKRGKKATAGKAAKPK